MRNEGTKQLLIGVLGCFLAAPGCVSIRHESELGTREFVPLQSCCEAEPCQTLGSQTQCCEIGCEVSDLNHSSDLNHPTEMPVHGIQPLVPLKNAASAAVIGLRNGGARIGDSVVRLKGKVHTHCVDWQAKHKQKSNPPPWPKFHPVPAKPVFEAAAGDMATAPGTFGAFGPATE